MSAGLALLLVIGLVFESPGQDFLSLIRKNLDLDQRSSPNEKVYLHLDRPFYMTGESVYFSAYTTEGYLQKPSTLSTNVHVELHSPAGKLLKRITIQAKEGQGKGYFDLADTLSTGSYQIRAYTSWMQNFDNDFIFQRAVRVYSLFETPQATTVQAALPPLMDLQFLPEGGSWLYGVESRIAFKAIDETGKGVYVRGKIYDDLQREVSDFHTKHHGMGMITLRPETGRTYEARIDGLPAPVMLPAPSSVGYALKVINDGLSKNVQFQIRTPVTAADNHVTIVVQCRGRLIYSSNAVIASGELNGLIPRNAFLTGVNHITLFDKHRQPVAERLFYVDRKDTVAVKMSLGDSITGKRKSVSVDIEVRNPDGTPAKARLSLSATDDSQIVLGPNREMIASYLLLRSDLKGTVESPGYYFNPKNKDRFEDLDLLMLTHGWRRFTWKRIVDNEPVKISFPMERGFPISGTMKRNYSVKPIPHGKVSFLSKDFKTVFGAIETNAAGRFRVDNIQVDGPSEILFQGHFKKEKRTDVWFAFDTLQVIAAPGRNVCPPSDEMGEFERNFVNMGIARRTIDERFEVEREITMLDEVVVVGKKIPTTVREKLNAESRGYKRTITVESTSWANHPFELLRGKATGIGDCNRPIRIYWNGVQIIHISQLTAKDPNMVEEIDTACDLIAFWTRRGSYSNSATSFVLRGYQPSREFYSPKYHYQLPDHAKEDTRVTLDWQPELQTDDQGKVRFEFYTSDMATTISLSAEGITSKGIPFVVQRRMKVVD